MLKLSDEAKRYVRLCKIDHADDCPALNGSMETALGGQGQNRRGTACSCGAAEVKAYLESAK